MKKLFAIFACIALAGFAFAQGSPDAYVDPVEEIDNHRMIDSLKSVAEIIVPENQHLYDSNAHVYFEYQPLYGEIRIYYETWMSSFELGDAMNTCVECLNDFMRAKEYTVDGNTKTKETYSHYDFIRPYRVKYYKDAKGLRRAQYVSYLKLVR